LKRIRQKDVAVILGIGHFTYMTWEKDQKTPFPRYYPHIIEWLGYDPFPKPETDGQELRQARLRRGMTAQQAADEVGVDQGTWLRFENDRALMSEIRRKIIEWAVRHEADKICTLHLSAKSL
jgi:DNA-binding XRE family transcriptional regulator